MRVDYILDEINNSNTTSGEQGPVACLRVHLPAERALSPRACLHVSPQGGRGSRP